MSRKHHEPGKDSADRRFLEQLVEIVRRGD
jgi:hypothetical protein